MSKLGSKSIRRKWQMYWHHDRLKRELNPFFDWKIILFTGIILFILVLVIQSYIYLKYIYSEPVAGISADSGSTPEMIDLIKLEKVVSLINTRQLEFEALSAKRPKVADPYK